jgi:phosphatidylserine/phosphatidylglycerophosphate/cardiolipin synthase-like enzyme
MKWIREVLHAAAVRGIDVEVVLPNMGIPDEGSQLDLSAEKEGPDAEPLLPSTVAADRL